MAERTLTRREILARGGALAAAAWLGGGSGCATGVRQPEPKGPVAAATLRLTRHPVGRIGPRFAGLSYEKGWLAVPCFTEGNSELIGLFRGLGPSLLRIGGNTVDSTPWRPGGRGRTWGEVAPADIDALAGFLRRCGWQVLYGVNLATSTAAAAADEVAYAAGALGTTLSGIEIGNEPDQYGGHYFPSWSLGDFEQRWEQFRRAILERTPHLAMTGPAAAGSIERWTVPFGEHVGREKLALLTQHYYRGSGRSPGATAARLLSPDETLESDLAALRRGAAGIGIPFRLGETNSFFWGGAPGVSNSYASALWVIDHLFRIALGGAEGANLHGGGSGEGYSPIADRTGVVIEARPEYYGMRLFTLAGEGTLLEAGLSAPGLDATAYALEHPDGSLAVVVVNKEAAKSLHLSIDCGRRVRKATLIAMSGPALGATGDVRIQGAAVAPDGSFAPGAPYVLASAASRVTGYIDALSAALIRVG
jgi:hypothetical protein